MNKPYSESCDQNKLPILSIIKPLCSSVSSVLEIGSGTGQHAIFFAAEMPHLIWHTSDCEDYLSGINSWLAEAELGNTVAPVELNVSSSVWPSISPDVVFTANSIHIMSFEDVENLMSGVGELLKDNAFLFIYGPFNYNSQYTSESNKRFDQWLKDRDQASGIKNFEDIVSLAKENAMSLVTDYEMPANNRLLHFVKM